MGAFYIHYADPGFPDPPWPNARRLGPFLTLVEAEVQAIEGVATGYGEPLGIWEEQDSNSAEMRDEHDTENSGKKPAAVISGGVLTKRGSDLAAEYAEDRRLQFEKDAIAQSGASITEIAAVDAELEKRKRERAAKMSELLQKDGAK